jgi:hypothetical protein
MRGGRRQGLCWYATSMRVPWTLIGSTVHDGLVAGQPVPVHPRADVAVPVPLKVLARSKTKANWL